MEGWYNQEEAGWRKVGRLTKINRILIHIDAQEVLLTNEWIVQLDEDVSIVRLSVLENLEQLFLEKAIGIRHANTVHVSRVVSLFSLGLDGYELQVTLRFSIFVFCHLTGKPSIAVNRNNGMDALGISRCPIESP